MQEAVSLLRANYIQPADVDDRALARATLSGLLARLQNGAMLLPKPDSHAIVPEVIPDAFASEVLGGRTGYIRLGALTKEHLASLDKALKGFADQNLDTLILDLRATGQNTDFELAADVIRRFRRQGGGRFSLCGRPATIKNACLPRTPIRLFSGDGRAGGRREHRGAG